MKWLRRRWWLIALVLVLFVSGAIWRALHPSASLTFLEFRNLGDERCAVFLLRNEGSQGLFYADSYWAYNEHSRSEPDVIYMVGQSRRWPSSPGVLMKPLLSRLEPGESREVYAPATSKTGEESEKPLTEPFRAGLKLEPDLNWVRRLGSIVGWNADDYVWHQQRKRQFEVWSEVVTP